MRDTYAERAIAKLTVTEADASKPVGVALEDGAGALAGAVLDPANLVAVELDVPAGLGRALIGEAHGVALDTPLAGVVLALDGAVRRVVFGVRAARIHVALDGAVGDRGADLIAGGGGQRRAADCHHQRERQQERRSHRRPSQGWRSTLNYTRRAAGLDHASVMIPVAAVTLRM